MRTRHSSDVIDSDVDTPLEANEEMQVTESQTRFAPAQFVHAAIGVFLVVVGIVAMVRGDLSGD